jgi:hypothetical protein
LSAGHCTALTSTTSRSHGGVYYGFVDAHSYSGNNDVERIRRSSSYQESGKYFSEGSDPVLVSSFTAYDNIVIGQFAGKTGASTGTTRGAVTAKGIDPGYVPGTASRFVRAEYCGRPGDSGGGVWRSGSAYGVHSGHFTGTACNRNDGVRVTYSDGGQGIFMPIDGAMSAMGVQLLGNLNLPPRASFTSSCDLLLNCSFNGWRWFHCVVELDLRRWHWSQRAHGLPSLLAPG